MTTQYHQTPRTLRPTLRAVPDLPELTSVPPLAVTSTRARGLYDRFGKPALDFLGALLLLITMLPVMGLIALAVWTRLGRPIFYKQPRVGRDGEIFHMVKFRTMRPDRRGRREPIPHSDRRRRHKTPDDPRHTDLGRFLRRFSLDELPQVWNVLRGEMSLVGPRPELQSVVETYDDWQHERHQVKPGITGLWQVTVRGTSGGDMHLHTDVDLDYLAQLSLRTDVKILLKTLPAALGSARGA